MNPKLLLSPLAALASLGCADILGFEEGNFTEGAGVGGSSAVLSQSGGAKATGGVSGAMGGAFSSILSTSAGSSSLSSTGGTNADSTHSSGGANANGGTTAVAASGFGGTLTSIGGASSVGASSFGGMMQSGGAFALGGTGPSGIGGLVSTGGGSSDGGTGATETTIGGSPAVGGTSAGDTSATGGDTSTGGDTATGGVVSTGGDTGTGGTPATGGSITTGGTPATGGSIPTGGTLATGGSITTGGTPATGGSVPTGGTPNTGGTSSISVGCVVRVSQTLGSDGKTGDSWANSMATVQAGIDQAQALVTAGASTCEVWVAKGTYRPPSASTPIAMRTNVNVYGGFQGTETTRDQRNWTQYVTTLSGDMSGDDIAGDRSTNRTDNAATVVTGATSAELNGFTITGATYGFSSIQGAISQLHNCVFRDNSTGVYASDSTYPPSVTACTFDNNSIGAYAIGTSKLTVTSSTFNHCITPIKKMFGSANVSECVFTNNSGASVYQETTATVLRAQFRNNAGGIGTDTLVEVKDSLFFDSGTALSLVNSGSPGKLSCENCTIAWTSVPSSAVISVTGTYSNVSLLNSIVWGNGSTGIISGDGRFSYYDSIIIGGVTAGSRVNVTHVLDVDPKFVSLATGDLHLLPGSPAIDSTTATSSTLTVDLDGKPRVVGAAVDMGAYESQ